MRLADLRPVRFGRGMIVLKSSRGGRHRIALSTPNGDAAGLLHLFVWIDVGAYAWDRMRAHEDVAFTYVQRWWGLRHPRVLAWTYLNPDCQLSGAAL